MEIEIDKNEYHKQKKEIIKEKGQYIEYNVLIGEFDNKEPEVQLNVHNVTAETIASLILTLEETAKIVRKEYPIANLTTKMMESKFIGTENNEKRN